LNDKPTKKDAMAPERAQGTLPSASPDVPVGEGTMLADKYRVERVLGRGGMGIVVAATHVELDQRVALKFLLPEAMESVEVVERFAREARAAVKIESEHVARVIDVGKLENGLPYMVMEYLNGRDLAAELDEHLKLSVEDTLEYVLQACEAIAQAHALGIIHRDLKPANLFVTTRPDGTTSIKVLDFGISKVSLAGASPAEMSLTQTAAIMGSPTYMSPEQMRASRDVDPRADIWALGVILYELLAGQPPFMGSTMPELCASILKDAPEPLRNLRPDVPEEVETAIMRCLEKNPAARFSNVAELTAALVDFAPKRARISAERTARVLRGAGIKTASLKPALSNAPGGAAAPGVSAAAVSAPSVGSAPKTSANHGTPPARSAPSVATATATAGAWSQASQPEAKGEPVKAAHRTGGNVKWVAAGGLALAAVVGFIALRTSGTEVPATTTVLAPVAAVTSPAAADPPAKLVGVKNEGVKTEGARVEGEKSEGANGETSPERAGASPAASAAPSKNDITSGSKPRAKTPSPQAPTKAPTETQPAGPPAPTRKNPLSIEIK
jgi:serine/threonine-protein kinase